MHPITCIFISINNIFIQSNILNSVFDPFLKSLHSNAHARNRFMFYNQIQEMESCEKQLSKAIEQLNPIPMIILVTTFSTATLILLCLWFLFYSCEKVKTGMAR